MEEGFTLVQRNITAREYKVLRGSTGWDPIDPVSAEKGLNNSLFSVCVMHKGKAIGMGRVVGDGAVYFYIQDVIVLPEYQGQGWGDQLMKVIMNWIKEHAPENAFIGLMAAVGVKDFYQKWGFDERPAERPGMYMTISRQESPD